MNRDGLNNATRPNVRVVARPNCSTRVSTNPKKPCRAFNKSSNAGLLINFNKLIIITPIAKPFNNASPPSFTFFPYSPANLSNA